jgi:hypothetical protein
MRENKDYRKGDMEMTTHERRNKSLWILDMKNKKKGVRQ